MKFHSSPLMKTQEVFSHIELSTPKSVVVVTKSITPSHRVQMDWTGCVLKPTFGGRNSHQQAYHL